MPRASRRKAVALEVPVTLEEAAALANRYAALEADLLEIEAERAIRLAGVNRDCDTRIESRADELTGLFAQLKGWWEAHGPSVAGKKRSAHVGGCVLGINLTPHALAAVKPETQASLLEKLQRVRWSEAKRFLRHSVTLNKEALVEALKAKAGDAPALRVREQLERMGFTLAQRDEFYIDAQRQEDGK